MTDETARHNWERAIARARAGRPLADFRYSPGGDTVCPSCQGERGIECGAGDQWHTIVCPTCEGSGYAELTTEDDDDAE